MIAAVRAALSGLLLAAMAGGAGDRALPVVIDYPRDGSIFPPEITPPQFLWRGGANGARWRIEISFSDGYPAIHTTSQGEPPRIGAIDPDCVADTNEAPRLTAQQAASHTWTPSPAIWAAIKKHSVAGPAAVAISGPASRASIRIRTSRDPVGPPSSIAMCR